MKNDFPLYFIAIVPDSRVQEEITKFKEYASLHFDSKHALTAPAHITLKAPFRCSDNQLVELKKTLTKFAASRPAFEIELQNFDCFAPRVIFVKIKTEDALLDLQKDLMITLEQKAGLPADHRYPNFHPHMTVAFKDLRPDVFPAAWSWFKNLPYQNRFSVRSICILKHRNREWQISDCFQLGG